MMFFSKQKVSIIGSLLILVLLSGMSGMPPVKSGFDALPQVKISTPSYPVGVSGGERKLIPYRLTESGDRSGTITSRTYQFYTQFGVPLSDSFGPDPANIPVNPLQTSKWKEPVYLPASVANQARALEEYAIVLKTTYFGVSSTGEDFHAQASLLLLLPPAPFSKTAPANQAANQPTSLSIEWSSTVGAIDYEYCFDTVNNNSCNTGWIGSYGAQARLRDLPPGTTFYWQVRANNTAGTTYANNGVWWSFTTCSLYSVTVTNINDSGPGSLRQAILDSCPAGTINFSPSLFGKTITLASTLPAVDKPLTLDGGLQSIAVNGAGQHRILAVTGTGDLTLKNMTFLNGKHSAPCFSDQPVTPSCGGGIYSDGILTITNSTFSGNSAQNGGAIFIARGTAQITRSTFVNNSATNVGGGILSWTGTTKVSNSTFVGNSATQGGGLYNDVSYLALTNSTFSGNSATHGAGLYNAGIVLDFTNNILANSISGSDCYNEDGAGSISLNVSNLVEANASAPNHCVTPALTGDPQLGPLSSNGGLTQTMPLLPGSPGIDAGDDPTCLSMDQRGLIRPQGSHCDIGAYEANGSVDISIGGAFMGSYHMLNGASRRASYTGVNDGPIQMVNPGGSAIFGAERVIYKVNGVNTSFSEMMGLPEGQLDNTYWLPWYNSKDLDTQLRFANVTNQPAQVHVYIGGAEMTGSPFPLAAGESTRKSFPGINAGPVKIQSNVNIVAAERVIYKVNGVNTSFTEMTALPNSQLDNTYWLPWYNNADLDTQLRFANVTGSPAQVHVFIGGTEMTGSPFTLAAGESTRKSFAGVNAGPVQIVSDQNLVAAERLIYKVNGKNTSFSEMMALPDSQIDTAFWLPWYNNQDLDTQLRFANASNATATVHVYVGGVEMAGSPFSLAAGASTRKSFAGVNAGPVQIVSDVPIVVAARVVYKVNGVNTSFSEMMGMPNGQLDNIYWLPWYNNVELDTQLRFGVP